MNREFGSALAEDEPRLEVYGAGWFSVVVDDYLSGHQAFAGPQEFLLQKVDLSTAHQIVTHQVFVENLNFEF